MRENRRRNDRRRAGFTLAELLIVVAILGVLAAVAVPVFTGTLEKSRETVCLNNRIVLQRHLMYDHMGDEKKEPTQDALSAYMASDKAECPAGGSYRLEYNKATGSVAVSCSKHAPGGLTNQVAAQNEIDKFIKEYNKTGKPQNQTSLLKAFKEYLKENGDKRFEISQEEVLSLFPPINGKTPTAFQGLPAEEQLLWMPVRLSYGGTTHDAMMVTSTGILNGGNSGNNNPNKGYLLYCDGNYYYSAVMNGMKTAYDASWLTSNNTNVSLEELLGKNWVKVEK